MALRTYELLDGPSIRCSFCRRVSRNAAYVERKYCGHCKILHEEAGVCVEHLLAGIIGLYNVCGVSPPANSMARIAWGIANSILADAPSQRSPVH